MYIQVLVEEQISAGQKVVEELRREGIPISRQHAFWCRVPDSAYWRLVIGSRIVDKLGPLATYGRLHNVLRKLHVWDLSGSISILSPNDPTFKYFLEYAHGPGQSGVSAAMPPNHNVFQDVYFYG